MIFGSQSFLYALPLAGLPIVFHLLMRRKRPRFDVSTFLFFLRADPRLASRRRLKEMLLLALRSLFIAAILLALSRPVLERIGRGRGPVALAIVIDNSGSMTAPGIRGETKLQTAVESARGLAESLPPGSIAFLSLLVDDPAVPSFARSTADRMEILGALNAIRPTQASGNPERALRLASERLDQDRRNTGLPAAMHVFSDFQKGEWDRPAVTAEALASLPSPVFHRIRDSGEPRANVAIAGLTLPTPYVVAGHPHTVRATLRNDSDRALDLRVRTEDSLGNIDLHPLTIGPRAAETVSAAMRPMEPGIHWLRFDVEGDGFAADNRAFAGLVCRAPAQVLLVGEPSEFGLLPAAISPTGDGRHTALIPRFSSLGNLRRNMDADKPVLVVVAWNVFAALPGEFHHLLRAYTQAGGNLLTLPPTGSGPPAASGDPSWIEARLLDRVEGNDLSLEVLAPDSDLWGPLRGESGRMTPRRFTAARFHPLDLASEYTVIVGARSGEPVIAARPFGDGRLYVSGVPFDSSWSSLANDPSGAGMLLAHRMALRDRAASGVRTIELVAGERLPLPAAARAADVVSVAGDAIRTTLTPDAAAVFPRSGVFRLRADNREYCLWVRPSDREGARDFVEGDTCEALAGVAHRIRDLPLSDGRGIRPPSAGGASLFLPFLILAAAVWMAQSRLETSGDAPRHRPSTTTDDG